MSFQGWMAISRVIFYSLARKEESNTRVSFSFDSSSRNEDLQNHAKVGNDHQFKLQQSKLQQWY